MRQQRRVEALTEFVAVARRLSFTEAAAELGIDASSLSRRIAALEARLGVRLLHRTTRRVSLTEAGAEYYGRALEVLRQMDEAEAAVSEHASGVTGRLRMAVPNLFGQKQIAPLMPEFMRRHPALDLELTFSDAFHDLIDERLDCAVRIGALERGGDLIVRRLAPNRRLLCASPDYLAAKGAPVSPNDLANHRLLHFRPLLSGQTWKLTADGEQIELPVRAAYAADNAEALRLAAVGGQGIAMLATFVVGDDLRCGALVPVLPEWRPAESVVSIVYPSTPFLPRRVRAVIDFLADAFSGTPPWEGNMG